MAILRSHLIGEAVSRTPKIIHRGCPYCAESVRIENARDGLIVTCEMCQEPSLYQRGELQQALPDDDGDYFGRYENDP